MITFYGVSISVHVRKAVVTAIAKGIDYKLEPVLPINPPPDWAALSPTGQVPAMQDGDFTLSESSAICVPPLKYHPWLDGCLTATPYRGPGQRMVGSLTGPLHTD
jgi:glutathione S-transferase